MTTPPLSNEQDSSTRVTGEVHDKHTVVIPAKAKPSHSNLVSNIVVILALLGLGGFLLHHLGVPIPGLTNTQSVEMIPETIQASGVELIKNPDQTLTLKVPNDVADSLGIRRAGKDLVAPALEAKEKRPLVLSGSTALDPLTLWRMRIRFPSAEVIELGKTPIKRAPGSQESPDMEQFRELRPGDRVKKGDLLMVLHSVDVGQKKNDLIDAQVQLKLDQEILDRASTSAAVPEVFVLNAKRNVEADRNSMVRAENTLRTWSIPEDDIKAAHDEAERIGREGWQNRNRDVGINSPWARVRMLAPESGVIVERNASLHETIVDNTLNLMQIAQVDRLLVVANAFEDELNSLLKLPLSERRWAIRTINQSNQPIEPGEMPANGDAQALTGEIEDVGYLIDINQRSAVLKGHIDNKGDKLRAGQYVTATVLVPPPENVVTIPIQAIEEDYWGQTLVFVKKKDTPERMFTLTRVKILQRFDKVAYVSTRIVENQKPVTDEEKARGILTLSPLKPGDQVLVAGVLELKKELDDKLNEN